MLEYKLSNEQYFDVTKSIHRKKKVLSKPAKKK